MKKFILALAAILVLHSQLLSAATSAEEKRFVAAAKLAFANHDADAMMALTCWDRVPDKFKTSGKRQYSKEVLEPVTDVRLIKPDPNFPDLEWKDTDGVSYQSNLPVVKQLRVSWDGGNALYPVGEKDGVPVLVATGAGEVRKCTVTHPRNNPPEAGE